MTIRDPDTDDTHYEYIDYIGDDKIEHFLPDSDWEYLDFKQRIKDEWENAMAAAAK